MHKPRTELSTHEVANQPRPPGDLDLLRDPALAEPLKAAFARCDAARKKSGTASLQMPHIAEFAKLVGSQEARELGRQADENPPRLKAFNAQGARIDEVEFHPAYHRLMTMGLQGEVSSRAWTHPTGGHIAHASLLYMMSWADSGVTCPMSMTYAAQPVLQRADWSTDWAEKARTPAYDPSALPIQNKSAATIGMAMTEKQGGSDVRANSTVARPVGDGGPGGEYLLTGHKWFCSAPMSDAFLTLAHTERGLSCFLVPRFRPDGTRNTIFVQRLKNKLGNRSNASSEIEYHDTWAQMVGDEGKGVRTIVAMVHHTRLDAGCAPVGMMRQSLTRALHHVRHRKAFGKLLIDQPLMRNVLADIALDLEACTAMAFRVARSFDEAHTDETQARFSRLATAVN